MLDGGAGDDCLSASGGNNILLGGLGDDRLNAGSGRDILIGSAGADQLRGRGGGDLLIAGTTTDDADLTKLIHILAESTSAACHNDRVLALRAGSTSVPKLDATTVLDDCDRDELFGGDGLDWFFAGPNDKVHGRVTAEQVN